MCYFTAVSCCRTAVLSQATENPIRFSWKWRTDRQTSRQSMLCFNWSYNDKVIHLFNPLNNLFSYQHFPCNNCHLRLYPYWWTDVWATKKFCGYTNYVWCKKRVGNDLTRWIVCPLSQGGKRDGGSIMYVKHNMDCSIRHYGVVFLEHNWPRNLLSLWARKAVSSHKILLLSRIIKYINFNKSSFFKQLHT